MTQALEEKQMFVMTLKTEKGEELAQLKLVPQNPQANSRLVNYRAILDENEATSVLFENVPRRADMLQFAMEALAAFGYSATGKLKPVKQTKKTKTEAPEMR